MLKDDYNVLFTQNNLVKLYNNYNEKASCGKYVSDAYYSWYNNDEAPYNNAYGAIYNWYWQDQRTWIESSFENA